MKARFRSTIFKEYQGNNFLITWEQRNLCALAIPVASSRPKPRPRPNALVQTERGKNHESESSQVDAARRSRLAIDRKPHLRTLVTSASSPAASLVATPCQSPGRTEPRARSRRWRSIAYRSSQSSFRQAGLREPAHAVDLGW